MTYIRIDTKTKQAKKFVELIETMPFAEILKEPNNTTKKAMESVVKGKTTKYKNAKELIASLNK
jgi:RNase H-fold protein (predicted Holliday junction resolvase)